MKDNLASLTDAKKKYDEQYDFLTTVVEKNQEQEDIDIATLEKAEEAAIAEENVAQGDLDEEEKADIESKDVEVVIKTEELIAKKK